MFRSVVSRRFRALPAVAAAVLLGGVNAGCATRDRPDFAPGNGPDQIGPSTTIDSPTQDTTVTAGPAVQVSGRTLDQDGIDTIYAQTEGGVSAFLPETNAGTTFRFGYPITTNNLAGHVITIRIFGTDRLGNRGDTATRRITVQ
jgi:hypothetical protein